MDSGDKLVDFDGFLTETGLDKDTVRELYEGFLIEIGDERESLLSEFIKRDINRLAKTVHNIKGISGSYKLMQVFEQARGLDADMKSNRLEGLETAVRSLESCIDQAMTEIRNYLSK